MTLPAAERSTALTNTRRRAKPHTGDGSRSTRSITIRCMVGLARAGAIASARRTPATTASVARMRMRGRLLRPGHEPEAVGDRHEREEIHLGGHGAVGPVVDDERQALI